MNSLPNLILRADANEQIGIGHAMRMLALAQAWRQIGGQVTYVFGSCPSHGLHRFEQAGGRLVQISAPPGSEAEALEVARLAKELSPAIVALDGYHFREGYLQVLENDRVPVVLVDDMGISGPCAAELVLNQNLAAHPRLYPEIPPHKLLLGPAYALLRAEFQKADQRSHPPKVRRLLLTFGGSDVQNATARLMEIVADSVGECVVVVGPSNPRLPELQHLAQNLSGSCQFHLAANVEDMAAVMLWAEAAVAAAGSSALEMAATGLPALYLATAENQEMVGEGIRLTGIGVYAGRLPDAWESLPEKLEAFLTDPILRGKLSKSGREVVDGQGASRVAQRLQHLIVK